MVEQGWGVTPTTFTWPLNKTALIANNVAIYNTLYPKKCFLGYIVLSALLFLEAENRLYGNMIYSMRLSCQK